MRQPRSKSPSRRRQHCSASTRSSPGCTSAAPSTRSARTTTSKRCSGTSRRSSGIGHALLALGLVGEARNAYTRVIRERFGDDHFRNTLVELELLRLRRPGLRGLDEFVELFERAQAELDAESAGD